MPAKVVVLLDISASASTEHLRQGGSTIRKSVPFHVSCTASRLQVLEIGRQFVEWSHSFRSMRQQRLQRVSLLA